MKDEGEWSIPLTQIDVEGLAGLDSRDHGGHGEYGRKTGDGGEDAFCSGRTEAGYEDLQHGAQQKGTWRSQNEGYGCHA